MRECLLKEVCYRTSRASGPGGQHVNKTETRVELSWNLFDSHCMDERQKTLVRSHLASSLNEKGILQMSSEKHRSQLRNKEDVKLRFLKLIEACLVPEKKRVATRPSRASREQRLKSKKLRGETKRQRDFRPGDEC